MSDCDPSPPPFGEVIFKQGDGGMFRRKADGTVEPLEVPEAEEISKLHARLKSTIEEREAAIGKLAKAEAELAEISQRQGATWHHWTDIAAMPQVWTSNANRPGDTCHESVMRSFHVAEEVRRLLELGTPVAVVLLVMDLLESRGRV